MNSLIWVIACVAAELVIGFLLGYAIELFLKRGRSLFRTLFFLPMVITPSVVAFVFVRLYAPDYGFIAGVFSTLGLGDEFPAILGSVSTATLGVIVTNIWQWCGFFVLMYSVGISQIDQSLIDASVIDGATGLRRIWHVVLPLLRSTHVSMIVLGSIQALQQFPLVYLMTAGGPADASQTLATYIFKIGFSENRPHYASAIAITLLVLSMIVIGVEYILARKFLSASD